MAKLSDEEKSTLSQLTQIEETYNFFKGRLDTAKADFKTSKLAYTKKELELSELEGELEDEDDITRRLQLREDVEKLKQEVEKLKQEAEAKKQSMEYLKGEIDGSIEKMKALPGMGQALQTVLTREYKRKIAKLSQDQEMIIKNKGILGKLQKLMDENETDNAQEISDTFKNMLTAQLVVQQEAKGLNEKISNLDREITREKDPKKSASLTEDRQKLVDRLNEIVNDYQNKRDEFAKLAGDEFVQFSEEDLNQLSEFMNNAIKKSKKTLNLNDINKVIEEQLAKHDKEIKLYDNQKAVYENAKSGEPLPNQQPPQSGPYTPNNGGEKLHWWNRLSNWWKSRKQDKLPAPESTPTENNGKVHKEFVKELQKSAMVNTIVNREMRDSNDLVADIRKQYEKQSQDEEKDDI